MCNCAKSKRQRTKDNLIMFKNIYKLYIFKNNVQQSKTVYDKFIVAYTDFKFFINIINKKAIIDINKSIIKFKCSNDSGKDDTINEKYTYEYDGKIMICNVYISNTTTNKNIKITFKFDDYKYDIILINKITRKNNYKIVYDNSQMLETIVE